MPRLLVVIASTRPGRAGLPNGRWFAGRAEQHGGFDVEVADLLELDLPFLDEPKHPKLGDYARAHTKAWAGTVGAADAFAFVMPEYNHGYTAPLKNALDFLGPEWQRKPVGFVSYGGVAGGTRAVQQLKPVCVVLGLVPAVPAVHIPFGPGQVEDGVFAGDEPLEKAAAVMLDELASLDSALRTLRS